MTQLTSYNPATGEIVWQGEISDVKQVDSAVKKARKALASWMLTDFSEREAILLKYKIILEKNLDTIVTAISNEVGKPFWEAQMEADRMLPKIDLSLQAYHERTGYKEADIAAGKSVILHKPHGVLAVFGPFNFPGHLPNAHIVPALLAGNTIVLKPSEQTPYTAELILQYLHEAGLPEGVVNIVHGAMETGKALSQHEDINGLLFTGSYHVGQILHKNFGGHPEKILALEMGGNNPLVIDSPNNTKAAVLNTINSSFITSGQRCTCGRRIIVIKSQKGDEYIEALEQSLSGIKVAAPSRESEPFMGSVISATAAKHMLEQQQSLLDKGAKPIHPMQALDLGDAFIAPGIIDSTDIDAGDEEIFGPLVQIIRVDNFEQAIQQANNTRYGLSSSLLSDDPEKFKEFYQKIHAGLVNWNHPTTGAAGGAPFGGTGYSGNHRPTAYYAADYCAYPSASVQTAQLEMPEKLPPGLTL